MAGEGANLVPRSGDLGRVASATEGTVVLVERSCRIAETRLGLADQLGELPLPLSERGEGPTVLVEAKAQRVGGRLVRGGLPHEGT